MLLKQFPDKDQFHQYDYDWMFLSYLNNDAWPHPQSDEKLLARSQKIPSWVMKSGRNLMVVQWASSLLSQDFTPSDLEPRVPINVFVEKYRSLIESAKSKGARVMILDYRADYEGYGNYEPYSNALKKLSAEMNVHYFPILENAREPLNNLKLLEKKYDCRRVKSRWGMLVERLPHLYLYAEYYPEHLNEIGTAWLADTIAPIILSEP